MSSLIVRLTLPLLLRLLSRQLLLHLCSDLLLLLLRSDRKCYAVFINKVDVVLAMLVSLRMMKVSYIRQPGAYVRRLPAGFVMDLTEAASSKS